MKSCIYSTAATVCCSSPLKSVIKSYLLTSSPALPLNRRSGTVNTSALHFMNNSAVV